MFNARGHPAVWGPIIYRDIILKKSSYANAYSGGPAQARISTNCLCQPHLECNSHTRNRRLITNGSSIIASSEMALSFFAPAATPPPPVPPPSSPAPSCAAALPNSSSPACFAARWLGACRERTAASLRWPASFRAKICEKHASDSHVRFRRQRLRLRQYAEDAFIILIKRRCDRGHQLSSRVVVRKASCHSLRRSWQVERHHVRAQLPRRTRKLERKPLWFIFELL